MRDTSDGAPKSLAAMLRLSVLHVLSPHSSCPPISSISTPSLLISKTCKHFSSRKSIVPKIALKKLLKRNLRIVMHQLRQYGRKRLLYPKSVKDTECGGGRRTGDRGGGRMCGVRRGRADLYG